jgi:hypothetical protein
MPAPEVRQRVSLLCGGARLSVDLLALLGQERAVNVIGAPPELATGEPPADVVVVDVPAKHRRSICEEIRYYYRGPLIVLLHPGDNSHDLPPDRSRTLLSRPFSMHDLAVALDTAGPASTAWHPAGRLPLLPPHGAQGRGAGPGLDKGRTAVAQAVPQLVRSLVERRLVRMSAILAVAALASVVAFGLANQHDRCPPRCDELTGAGDVTSSSGTTVHAVGVGQETVDPGAGVAGPTATSPSGSPAAVGGSRTEVATGGGTRSSTTTSRPSGAPSQTSPPDPTRPQPSASSSTAPTTTTPRPTTTATISSTTTSSTTTTTTVFG